MKTIRDCIKNKVSALTHTAEADYQPGNGTRYHLYHGVIPDMHEQVEGYFFCAWLKRGGSGGEIMRCSIGAHVHWTYVQEKMDLYSSEDAKAIAHFMNSINDSRYYPETVSDDDLPKGVGPRA